MGTRFQSRQLRERRHAGADKQEGLTLSGLLGAAALLIVVLLVGFKVAPSYIQFFSLQKVLKDVVNDPELQNASVAEIRKSLGRRAQIADVTAVTPEDVVVTKESGGISLSASYSVKVPLAGNVSACMDFDAHASR